MTPQRYRTKPVVIEAMRLTTENAKDVCDWIHGATHAELSVHYDQAGNVEIDTLEGAMRADIGDWVIRDVKGKFHPCKPDTFDAAYLAEPA